MFDVIEVSFSTSRKAFDFIPSPSSFTLVLHHLSIGVRNLVQSTLFYDAVLAELGYVRVWGDDLAVGYGIAGGGDKFAIKLNQEASSANSGSHVAFAAPSRDAVGRFHTAALSHGGENNGEPESCLEYGANYFAAFVIDPEGNRIEAVINTPG